MMWPKVANLIFPRQVEPVDEGQRHFVEIESMLEQDPAHDLEQQN